MCGLVGPGIGHGGSIGKRRGHRGRSHLHGFPLLLSLLQQPSLSLSLSHSLSRAANGSL
jgi:hypothetical protein